MLKKPKDSFLKLLRWSEKYTKTDMIYMVKNGFWLIASSAVSMCSAFILSWSFANLLPKEVYGQYKYIVSVLTLLAMTTLNGMGTAISRASARGMDGSIDEAVRTEKRWGIIGGLLCAGIALFYFWRGDAALALAFGIAAPFVPFINVYILYSAVVYGKQLFSLGFRYELITNLSNAALMITALLLTGKLWLLILPFLFTNTFMQRGLFAHMKKTLKLNTVKDPEAVSHGKHMSLIYAIATTAQYLDQLLVFNYLGPAQLAIYNMALAPTEQLKGIFKLIGPLAFPKMAQAKPEELRKSIYAKTLKYGILIAIPISAFIALAPFLYSILFPQYMESVGYARWFALSLFLSASFVPITMLQAHGRIQEQYHLNIGASFFQIVCLLVGAQFFGLPGVVASRILKRVLDLVLGLYLVKAKPVAKT